MQQQEISVSLSKEEQQKILNEISQEESFNVTRVPKDNDQNAIYIEDTQQQALIKLLKLSTCQFNERLIYTKHLGELMELLGEEGVKNLPKILDQMVNDLDEIKSALILQLPIIGKYLMQRQTGYQEIETMIMPILKKLLQTNSLDVLFFHFQYIQYQIKEKAGQLISRIAPYLNEDDRGNHILPTVLSMAHDEQNEENKIVAVQIIGKLCHIFGQSLTESFIAFEILSLGEDAKLLVRKEAVQQLGNVSKVVSPQFFKVRLLPFYYKKCQEKVSKIRQSCVEIIVDLSRISTIQQRESELTDQMINFLKDSNKQVKGQAFIYLGRFISTLEECQNLNDRLLEFYCKMADSDIRDLEKDNQVLRSCSFNFPAVLTVFGQQKWPQLHKLFNTLMKSKDRRVRRPLACCLHEIALIIGSQKAAKDLLPVFDTIFKDPVEEIRHGAIKNLWQFIKIFDDSKKEHLMDVILYLQKDQKKWRSRELIANQLHEFCQVFNPELVFSMIMPISFKLCTDNVSTVRKQACLQIYSLFEVLNDEGHRFIAIENIKGFAKSQTFSQRQSFAIMCSNLLKLSMFNEHFMEDLQKLGDDRVKNVRLLVFQVINNYYNQNDSNEQINSLRLKLLNEPFIQKCFQQVPSRSASVDDAFRSSTEFDDIKNSKLQEEILQEEQQQQDDQ